MTDGYDWYWYKAPCPKSGKACHWRSLFKQPRRFCEECIKEARDSFREAYKGERLAIERCFAPPIGGWHEE